MPLTHSEPHTIEKLSYSDLGKTHVMKFATRLSSNISAPTPPSLRLTQMCSWPSGL